ncbi:MAG: signal peptidase II [Elusimicrobiota bacterium]
MPRTSQDNGDSLSIGPRMAAVAALFALDRATKLWAINDLKPLFMRPVLPFFRFTYIENTGMAFGLGRARNGFFLVLSCALAAILIYLQKVWAKKNLWIQAGLILVVSGALGNIYDRAAYGHVVDFLDFMVWPVFNIADSCVTTGAFCLGLGFYFEESAAAASSRN